MEILSRLKPIQIELAGLLFVSHSLTYSLTPRSLHPGVGPPGCISDDLLMVEVLTVGR